MADQKKKINLTIKIRAGFNIDQNKLDSLTRQLFENLKEIVPVQEMKGIKSGHLPNGVRGTEMPTLINGLIINLLANGIVYFLTFLVGQIKYWKKVTGENIKIELKDDNNKKFTIKTDLSDNEIKVIEKAFNESVVTEIIINRKYALLIGNENYKDKKFPKLLKPAKDVKGLAEVLSDPNIAGFETRILIDKPMSIVQEEIALFFDQKIAEDLLLLYYAGHGIRDFKGQYHFAFVDTKSENLYGTALPASFIKDRMDDSYSKRKIIILDSCHSGAFAKGVRGGLVGSIGIKEAFEGNGYGRVVLTATDATQFAWENNKMVGEINESIFTNSLINGIKTGDADLDCDGKIDLDELYKYIYDDVTKKTPYQKPLRIVYESLGKLVIAYNLHGPFRPAINNFKQTKQSNGIDKKGFWDKTKKANQNKKTILLTIFLIGTLIIIAINLILTKQGIKKTEIQNIVGEEIKIPLKYRRGILNEQILSEGDFFTYSVTSGNNLKEISKFFRVPIDQIKNWNNLKTNWVSEGNKLRIKVSFNFNYYEYQVQLKDTSYSIAKNFNTNVDSLRFTNGKEDISLIKKGEILKIFTIKK